MVSVKKRLDIESLLRWAYRDELPKAHKLASFLPAEFGGAWGGIERYGELLEVIDAPENQFGVVPDLTSTAWPHEDAIRVHNAVCDLDRLPLNLPDGWNPLGDMPGFADAPQAVARALESGTYDDRNGERWLKTRAGHLIRKHAIMGGCPVWEAEEPKADVLRGLNGKPLWFRRVSVLIDSGDVAKGIAPVWQEVEVDGLDPKRRIPYPDAYQKTVYDHDPVDIVLARAEYEVWRAALDLLAIELEEGLDAHVVTPCTKPYRPWEEGGMPAGPRVLPSLAHPAYVLTLANGYWGVRREQA